MPTAAPRVTAPTRAVLNALRRQSVTRRLRAHAGRAEAHLAPGSLHPALARLESLGWVESWWHETAPGEPDYPRRRWYRLTPSGAQLARQALRQVDEARTQWKLRARPSAGAL